MNLFIGAKTEEGTQFDVLCGCFGRRARQTADWTESLN